MEIKSVKVDGSRVIGHGMFLLNPESQADIELNEGLHLFITAQSGSRNQSDTFKHGGDLFLRITAKDDFFGRYGFTTADDHKGHLDIEVFRRKRELITVYYSILIEED